MPTRTPNLPTTEDHRPLSEEEARRGSPTLLAAFPKQVAVALPAPGAPVGRAWLDEAGLLDSEVSRTHLRFVRAGGRLYIEDLESRHGTFLDGERLTPRERVPLDDGAVVRMGNSLFVYREAFEGPREPAHRIGRLVAPWGLGDVRAALARLAAYPVKNVLIEGDTGTGKELLAEEIARALKRGGDLFVRCNVAAISKKLFEGQLFGWEKGSFSGSVQANPGLFRSSHKGAVFLDEIGELPYDLQPKLLRLLENGEVLPLGGNRPIPVDVAIIAATNRSLQERVKSEHFRLDLLARFQARITLPRLADRPEDIFAILEALWPPSYGPLHRERLAVEVVEALMLHDWPTNVRDMVRLLSAVNPAVGLKRSLIQDVLGLETTSKTPPLTREAILKALEKHGGNQSRAAKELDVPRARLRRAMKRHGIG